MFRHVIGEEDSDIDENEIPKVQVVMDGVSDDDDDIVDNASPMARNTMMYKHKGSISQAYMNTVRRNNKDNLLFTSVQQPPLKDSVADL